MADSKVETLSRLARWRINSFEASPQANSVYFLRPSGGINSSSSHTLYIPSRSMGNPPSSFPWPDPKSRPGSSSSYRKSDPFKMGIWNWHLAVERNHQSSSHLSIRLSPESSKICEKYPPFARFSVRVSVPGPSQKLFTSEVNEKQFQTGKEFSWSIECSSANFVIDIEFLDLKSCNDGKDTLLWPGDGSGIMQSMVTQNNCRYLSRMIEEDIHTDVIINTSHGSLRAHKVILSVCSPVFRSMFNHNFKEKESSTINIEDMSLESCTVLLNYLYGTIKLVDFWENRLVLLSAANKYGIVDLKDVCEESLLEDISSNNVLERFQAAWLYQLDKLKKRCLMFLFEFGKVYDMVEEMNNFFKEVDGELKFEMFQIVLHCLKTHTLTSG